MGMRITDISLVDFRNYESFGLDDVGNLTIFIGRNGVGKTNLLEAIQLMTSANSFRHPRISQLVREGAERARVRMTATDGNRLLTTELSLESGKRRYAVNGKAKIAADVRGTLPAVIFTPDDLQLAKGSSSSKRSALDDMGSQLSRSYHVVLGDYEKTLRYKNRLLKEEAGADLIAAIDETLITCGSQLFCYRIALFGRLLPLMRNAYAGISSEGELFSAAYLPSWDYLAGVEIAEAGEGGLLVGSPLGLRDNGSPHRDRVRELMAENLLRHGPEELRRRRALVGPHNDKIAFFLSSRDASAFASQGQQRSIVLAWKLAEVELVRQTLSTDPVLLLDDVMSELDASRRDTLVHLASGDVQTFITATDLEGFNPAITDRARIVELGL